MKLLGVKKIPTIAYHSKVNGMVKRFYCTLKMILKVGEPSTCPHWLENLPLVLIGLQAAIKTDLNYLPAEVNIF